MVLNLLHILLADDDDDDRLFFKEALENIKMKLIITMVNDGVELMEYLTNENTKLPDVIFLDLNMPKKNGIQCLEEIRKNDKLKDLTIAIYSTSGAERDIEETFIKGANIYIKKPNDFTTLKKVVKKAMEINWQYYTANLSKDSFILSI